MWWQAFGDPTLDALVAEALVNNRDLRIASARVDEAAAIVSGTRSQGLPQVGYGASASRQRTSEPGSEPFVGNTRSSLGGVLLGELGNRPVGPHRARDRSRRAPTCWRPRRRAAA